MSVPKKPPLRWNDEEAKKRRMLSCPWSLAGRYDTAEELAVSIQQLRMLSGIDDEVSARQLAEFVFHTHRPRKNERLSVDISYGMGGKNEWIISVNRRRK